MIDIKGLTNTMNTLQNMEDALDLHIESAVKHDTAKDIFRLDEAAMGIMDARVAIKHFLKANGAEQD